MLRCDCHLFPSRVGLPCQRASKRLLNASVEHTANGVGAIKFAFDDSGERNAESSLQVPLVWLRDHCRGDSSFNALTFQRKSNLTDISQQSQLSSQNDGVKFDSKSQTLQIVWADGERSEFTAAQILQWMSPHEDVNLSALFLWNASAMLPAIPDVPFENFDKKKFAQLFVRFGVATVSGVDTTDRDVTRRLCESVAPIHNTFFGDFWTFGVEHEDASEEHDDTAYGNEEIGPHTDGTYFPQTPGIQVFHCIRPATRGGETYVVDGFAAAEELRRTRPAYFRRLSSTPVEHQYVEKEGDDRSRLKIYSRSWGPVIEIDEAGELLQIRFNPFDRAPHPLVVNGRTVPNEEIVEFYEAYECFSKIVNEPRNAITIALQPGTVIFIDNFRVLHARRAFEGPRLICGCYLSRDNFFALARPLLAEAHL